MYQKNRLKDLIYIQENKACNEQTLKGLFRSIVEPILENNTECAVLVRLEEKSKNLYNSILKRLEFSNAQVFDFSTEALSEKFANVLKDNIWEKTEFVFVLAERYGSILIFDYEISDAKDAVQYYIMHNSKTITDLFSLIIENSNKDLSEFSTKWKPDRRENELLNLSVRKIIDNLNETSQELLISQIEETEAKKEDDDASARLEFMLAKSGCIAHEMRNMLSIANLYSTIISKHSDKVTYADEETKKTIFNARECIKKSLQMVGNLLLDFKSIKNTTLKEYNLNEILDSAIKLSEVYAGAKNIKFSNANKLVSNILVDEYKFLTVLINLIKNAVESIEEKGDIIIDTESEDEIIKITISNNGKAISDELKGKIFQKGFTTKSTGSGLGLVICKKTLEEQCAQLRLKKSDDISTEFEITVLKG